MERFSSLGAECIVAREHHKDGGLHLHVFADFGRKFRSRKVDIFDVDGRHPNIEPSKGTPEKGYDYAIKDGDVICGGLARPDGESRTGAGSAFDKWSQITSAESREEFWELCHQLDPKSTACSFGQLAKYADWKFREDPPEYESPGGFEFIGGDVDGRDEWVRQAGIGLGEPLLGTSGTPLLPDAPSHGRIPLRGNPSDACGDGGLRALVQRYTRSLLIHFD